MDWKSFKSTQSPFVIGLITVGLILTCVRAQAESSLTSIIVTPADPSIIVDESKQFTATGMFDDGSSKILGTNLWVSKASMPTTTRERLAVGVVNEILYAVGGYRYSSALATMEAYDSTNDTWTAKAPMPTARYGLAVGVVDGILYAVGGADLNGAPLATVEAYDPATDTWTAKAPMPTARFGLAIGVVDGILYAVGGGPTSIYKVPAAYATVEAYDPATDTWSTKAPMPTARQYLAAGVIDGILYAAGGYNDPWYYSFTTLEAYNPATDTWSTKAPMPDTRSGPAIGVVRDTLYLVGDLSSYYVYPAATYAYSPSTDTWLVKPGMPQGRQYLAAGVVDNVVYAVGGADTDSSYPSPLSTVEAYFPSGSNLNITWGSSDPSVADIRSGGLAYAHNPGTAMITATSGSASGNVSGSTTLTVPAIYRLTLTYMGDLGYVTVDPPGNPPEMSCGYTEPTPVLDPLYQCTADFESGTTVTLTSFSLVGGWNHWRGACKGQGNPCVLVMDRNQDVLKHFAQSY